jgi:GNAT superfamily N-acetyltransferase
MDARLAPAYRPQSPDDDEFLYRVYASSRATEMQAWGWPPEQQESFLRMQFRARRLSYDAAYPDSSHSILLCDGAPAGSAIVWRSPAEIRLVDIALLPEYQNRGLGAQWLQWLIRESAAAGVALRLSVLQGNRAICLYQRLGFVAAPPGGMYIEMEYKRDGAE